jgi:hypothetical protein
MNRLALLVALGAVFLVPSTVPAQEASPTETQLQLQREQQRRVIVRPAPPAQTVERDVQEAATEAAQRQRQQEFVSDLRRPLPRRPDLDYDVKNGIQSQRLNDALRR